MTQNIFNLYSAQAFSEHPLALWGLDDDFSYLSLISASPIYSLTDAVSASVANPPTEKPQETVGISDIFIEIDSFTGSGSASIIETQSFSVSDTDSQKPTVNINSFIYTYDTNITSLQIGFRYDGDNYYSTYENLDTNSWTRIHHTMDLPDSGDVTPYISIIHPDPEKTYSLYQLSVGQWSEQYNHETQGSVTIPFENISASASLMGSVAGALSASPTIFDVVEVDEYGFSTANYGYYFVENNRMLSTNTKLPMVYGSGDITEVYASSNSIPSIVFPGKGFLHTNGKFSDLTAEFWLKIYPDNTTKKRIFGPLASEDGLYVDKDFITLRIGPYEKSYFINKWYRPMLVSIRYNQSFASVMINGELVIEQNLVPRDVDFPENITYDTDWVGFYSHDDIVKFEVDCLAIYPYIVSDQSAKKKFVYGQGVGQAQEITRKFGSTSVPVDFSFAGYSSNLIYPDMTNWYAGFYSNLDPTSQYLSIPKYQLPEISYLGDDLSAFNVDRRRKTWRSVAARTWYIWLSRIWRQISSSREIEPLFDNFDSQIDRTENFYFQTRPNSAYNNVYGSIVFNSLNILNEPARSILGVFSINQSEIDEKEAGTEISIMHFKNSATGDIFKIIFDDSDNKVKYIYNSTTLKEFEILISDDDTFFIAGIDINNLTDSFARIVKRFFSIPQNIKFNVAGNENNQFPGKIYRININNSFFTRKDMGDYFDSQGFASYSDEAEILESNSILSYIANYTLFFSKTNSSMIMDIASTGYWEDSVPLSYFGSYILNSKGERTGYDLDFLQFNIDYPSSIYSNDNFDDDRNVKIYATLQNYEDAGKISYSNYTITKGLDENRYVDFENIDSDIDATKFNIVDGTIIFAPKSIIDFNNAYLTIHMEIKDPGVGANPVNIQRMALSSLAYDQGSLYPLNSATGNKIYPFTRQGISYITKAKNPYLFYKDATPYLYLTSDSGVQALPYPDIEDTASETFRRGISIPLNQSRVDNYSLYGMHLWAFYNNASTITERQMVFSLSYQDTRYNFYLEPEVGGKRAKLVPYLYDILGEQEATEIVMYQNGIKQEVYINPLSWSLITIRFIEEIDLSNARGQFEIYPGFVVNNITMFEQNIEKKVDDIFESHLGLSNIVSQDSSTLALNFNELNLFSDITWTNFDGKPL
jgi:hypothetical protein